MKKTAKISRKDMVKLLNEDMAREFQAIIAYTVYSQTMKGAKYQAIARNSSCTRARSWITRCRSRSRSTATVPQPVKLSAKTGDMLRYDLQNEADTIKAYRTRIRQAAAMGEYGLSEVLREIIVQEQEHLTDLAGALGIDNPKIGE